MKQKLKLRVMAEYASSGIWGFSEKQSGAFRHGMIEHSDLKLPKELRERFEKWISEYTKNNLSNELDTNAFNTEGRELAKLLKEHMGPEQYVEYQGETDDGDLLNAEVIN